MKVSRTHRGHAVVTVLLQEGGPRRDPV